MEGEDLDEEQVMLEEDHELGEQIIKLLNLKSSQYWTPASLAKVLREMIRGE